MDGTNQPDWESGDLKAVKRCASNFRLALKGSRKSIFAEGTVGYESQLDDFYA
jgi:hypothetical protein